MKSIEMVRRYLALFAVATILVSGCATSEPAPERERLIDAPSEAEILFESVKDVFAERGIEDPLVVDEAMVAASQWIQVNKELRNRISVRVIEVHGGRGVALNVTSDYRRRNLLDGQEIWMKADDRLTLERAKKDEMELGAAIKARYDERKE